jgi:hypothetical protein
LENLLIFFGVFIFSAFSYFKTENLVYSAILFVITNIVIFLFIYFRNINLSLFCFSNEFVCFDGFAVYVCSGSTENIIISAELRYDEVENAFMIEKSEYAGLIYKQTDYSFIYYGKNNEILYEYSDFYKSSSRKPEYSQNNDYWFQKKSYFQFIESRFQSYKQRFVMGLDIGFPVLTNGNIIESLILTNYQISHSTQDKKTEIPLFKLERVEIKRNRLIFFLKDSFHFSDLFPKTLSVETIYLSNKEIFYKLLKDCDILAGKIHRID